MLILKELLWSNAFSYGIDNKIRFDENPLTQLVGTNGAGKTSISLMLQEILYGKNIKNIRKQDIANNKSGSKGYYILLTFEKDGIEYVAELDRKSGIKFKLFKDGEDISSHTSLNTYKTIAKIIGISEFKVFCQLIYQHSTDSLDFLTATDMNRKKFLISLLQLDRYLELHEMFKDKIKINNSEINTMSGSIDTIHAWINKHKDMDFIKQNLIPGPVVSEDWYVKSGELKRNLANINNINRKISINNEYITQLSNLNSKYYMGSAPVLPAPDSQELRTQVRIKENEYSTIQLKINKLIKVTGECPECLQQVNSVKITEMLDTEITHRDIIKKSVGEIWKDITNTESIELEAKKYKQEKLQFEKLNQLIDASLPKETLDKTEMGIKLNALTLDINKINQQIKEVEQQNIKIVAHNSKVDVVKNQLKEMKKELIGKDITLVEKENETNLLELLKKTFGTSGLVSYKIESSVKELERKINEYLAELTHFQLYFKLIGEKLNIEIVDDLGNSTSISNLSSGERARVNIATILSIRNILSSLTSTKINLLFLDEVIGVIDAEGKEKLSEILLKENLNTFIVSHDWSHPLIPRINIIKEKHISRIEYDR